MLQVLPAYLDITRINMHLVSVLFASYDKEIVTKYSYERCFKYCSLYTTTYAIT